MSEHPQFIADPDRFINLLTHSADGIIITDAAGITIWVNAGFRALCGHTSADIIGKKPGQLLQGPATDPAVVRRISAALRAGIGCTEELVNYHKDGHPYWVRLQITPLRNEQGHIVQFIAFEHKIPAPEAQPVSTHAGEPPYRQMVEALDDIISLHDATAQLLYISPAIERTTGYSRAELIESNIWDAIHPDDRELVVRPAYEQTMRGEPSVVEWRCRDRYGDYRWYITRSRPLHDADGQATHMLCISSDITLQKQADAERRLQERQLQETRRLESLAVLASGLAHDFNNLLMSILGHAELALFETASDTAVHDNLHTILRNVHSAAQLTQKMLTFAEQGDFALQALDLNQLLRNSSDLAAATVGRRCMLQYNLATDLAPIIADDSQIRQLLLNLLANAAEASPSGSIVTVTTTSDQLTAERLRRVRFGSYATPGSYIRLEIRDTGAGMDNATRERAFEPFFSTRFIGRGLGLAAVQGIVRSHQGAMDLTSLPGYGTTVEVWLPVMATAVTDAAPPPPPEPAPVLQPPPAILVVDDEEQVRRVLTQLLTRSGFQVHTAGDGPSALAMLNRHEQLCGVLLDLTMPLMPGGAVAHTIRSLHPDLPIVLMSGYPARELQRTYAHLQLAGFLQKPFTQETLNATLEPFVLRARTLGYS